MTDKERIDFLAEVTNLNALGEMGAMLTAEQARMLRKGSETVMKQYELHRRTHDTPKAFRLAVDDAAKAVNRRHDGGNANGN
jgi:hypothetical protein